MPRGDTRDSWLVCELGMLDSVLVPPEIADEIALPESRYRQGNDRLLDCLHEICLP